MEAELWNFKSQNILCTEVELQVTEYSACGISRVPYAVARIKRERRGTGPWVKAILEVLLFTVPSWRWPLLGSFVCFLRYYQAVKNQLTCDKDPNIRHTSWPKAAGTKLPTGSTRQSEGEFSTLLEGPRIGPRSILPRVPAGA